MSKSLGIGVVAEEVENQGQWDLLKELGCDKAQGYLMARPMSKEHATVYIEENLREQPEAKTAKNRQFKIA